MESKIFIIGIIFLNFLLAGCCKFQGSFKIELNKISKEYADGVMLGLYQHDNVETVHAWNDGKDRWIFTVIYK